MAKKQKMTAAMRKEQKLAKSAQYSNAAKKQAEAVHVQQEKVVPNHAPVTDTPSQKKAERKSLTKAAGLKSAIVVGDAVYLTSFGKGNAANTEVHITADNQAKSVLKDTQNPKLQIEDVSDAKVDFRGVIRLKDALKTDNPTHTKEGDTKASRSDMLSQKSELEKYYFGQTFDDNLHIQIIHCILDLEKLLAVHVGNAVYTLNNLLGADLPDGEDFIGYLSTRNSYDTFLHPENSRMDEQAQRNVRNSQSLFEKFLQCGRLGCFGSAFYQNEKQLRDQQEIYHMLCLIGQIRQNISHGSNQVLLSLIYDTAQIPQEFRDTMDKLYSEMLDKVNENFLKQNTVNLVMLKDVMPQEDFQEIVRLYYDFIVVKSYKNMGFSVKTLREKMLDGVDAQIYRDQQYDSMRNKLYKLLDFSLFYYFQKHPERTEQIVGQLRATLSEEDKERVYIAEAEALWTECKPLFEVIRQKMTGKEIKDAQIQDVISRQVSMEGVTRTAQATDFSKLIYLLTFFLDGKEINDLLTTLVNKFDNIASFLNVAKDIGVSCRFTNAYSLFAKSAAVAEELNVIRNLARMQKPQPSAKKVMYKDAIDILGMKQEISDAELDAMLNTILCLGDDGKKLKGADTGFRNFIASNVIESSRFHYLVKYCEPKKVRAMANNRVVVQFVLNRLPDEQIARYYQSCMNKANGVPQRDVMVKQLCDLIVNMRFDDFEDVKQNDRKSTPEEQRQKQRYQAIISLYLTVMYLLMKNLVNVNARYVIGFHCMERDAFFYGITCTDDYRAVTETLLNEPNSRSLYLRRNRRLRECVRQDLENSKKLKFNAKTDSVRHFRNNVAHLSVMRQAYQYMDDIREVDSYYGLYHYIMQRLLCDSAVRYVASAAEHPYFKSLLTYRTYCKDLTKAYCVPFGYNIPRFKNLSIKELFDRNETENA